MLPGNALVGSSAVSHGLSVLPEIASTDLHFVADDYSGSGNWTSRDSNAWTATVHGSLTRQATSQFVGRKELTGFSALNYFTLASNSAHSANGDLTYELVLLIPTPPANYQFIVSSGTIYTDPGAVQIYHNINTSQKLCGVTNSTGASNPNSAIGAGNTTKYVLLTFTNTQGTNKMIGYENGSATGNTATLGTYASNSLILSIGTLAGLYPFQGSIVEIVRHQSALDATTVAARAAQFNALKGY